MFAVEVAVPLATTSEVGTGELVADVDGVDEVGPATTPNVELAEGHTTASGTWTPAVEQISWAYAMDVC